MTEAFGGLWQTIVEADRDLFLTINHGFSAPWLDYSMPVITELGLGHVQLLLVLLVAAALTWRTHHPHFRVSSIRWAREALYVAGIGLIIAASWLVSTEEDLEAMRAGLPVWVQVAACGMLAVFVRLGYCAARRQSTWAGPVVAAIALSGLLSALGKTIPRERPWWYYAGLARAGQDTAHVRVVPGYYPNKVRGFPSGHTASSVAVAVSLTTLRRRRLVAAGVWIGALLVAFSRLYLATHWPLDVAGGLLVGLVSGLAGVAYSRAWARRPVEMASAGMAVVLALYCLIMVRPVERAVPVAAVLAPAGWLLVRRLYRPVECPDGQPPASARASA